MAFKPAQSYAEAGTIRLTLVSRVPGKFLLFRQFAYISVMTAAKKKKKFSWTSFLLLVIVIIGGVGVYILFGPNTGAFTQHEYLYIRTGATYDQVLETLEESGFVGDMAAFKLVAKALKLPENVHAGRYRVKKRMSNFNIVRMLRSGKQTPVKLVINRLRTKTDFVRLVSMNLEADSNQLRHLLGSSDYLDSFGVDTGTAMAMIIPDTYEFYWNTTAEKVLEKIHKNHIRFWNSNRVQKAKAHGVTPVQAVIIASIVDEETNMAGDKPKIASVYLNRIRIGMPLQADPTVKFAIGDFTIKRITSAMLQYNSPYNTYMYPGIPPGPICTPSTGSVNAVLDAPKTTYLYFCAKEDFSGYSAFASTFEEQIKNANAYRKALDARGIH